MAERLRVVIISYAYPRPGAGRGGTVGGERMHQFARRLPEHGIEPIVLTHCGQGPGWLSSNVYAARDIVRSLAESATARGQGSQEHPRGPREGWRVSGVRTSLRRWVLPDRASYAWGPFAIASATEVAGDGAPDAVISSSPPMAAHVVASILATLWGVPWIADVRDGYSFEPPEGRVILTPLRRAFERTLYKKAARVVTVTDALRDDLRSLLPEQCESILTITNGYDETMFTPAGEREPGDGAWEVLYAGSAVGAGRNIDVLLSGVDRFAVRVDCDVRLKLIGLFAPGEVARPLERARLELVDWQPRAALAPSMQRAGALVVLTGNHTSVATTKLFEYIGAARPIVVVGRDSAAARMVAEGGFGVCTDDDPDRIADALERVFRERSEWEARLSCPETRRARAGFARGVQAQQLARLIRGVSKK